MQNVKPETTKTVTRCSDIIGLPQKFGQALFVTASRSLL